MTLIIKFNEFLKNIGIDYAICGGHAIDLFLGKKMRPHKDLDAVVYWEDRDQIIQYMINSGWDVYEPCGTDYLHKINNIYNQKRIKSNIWCVKPENSHYKFTEKEKDMFSVEFDNLEQMELDYIEILFNSRKNNEFIYARNHDIRIKMDEAILMSGNIPFLAPEVVLLYKSKYPFVQENQLDFENTIHKMNVDQLKWFKTSLENEYTKEHEWLNYIDSKDLLE
jgi:hypothetical protein